MTSRSQLLVEHLPELRRYAAALAGSVARGDGLVEILVEMLLADPALLDPGNPRRSLMRLFDDLYDGFTPATEAEDASSAAALRAAVNRLPRQDRKILLLTSIMRMDRRDIGDLLGLSERNVAERLLAARESLRRRLSARVLVIEDEPIVAMSIANIVSRMGHRVCGVAQSRSEAFERARDGRPNLILADVRLRGGDDGIRTVEEIVDRTPMPVIFITGHAHDLILQLRMRPTLVIGKPFMPQTLEVAVQRVLSRQALTA